MIFVFTGQPGHGKTLHAIDRALEFRDQGRLVYVCNVREFNYEKAGVLPMTPEEFRDWPNSLPDGAVVLVDEAYQADMLPKRAPGKTVPDHVRELAVHRHRGIDFIFVAQSPKKQLDEFMHDLIEQHVHVRRRFGLMFAHLRIFDRYEANPEKAHPILLKRVKLPKRPMGLYKSTELDTSERRVPWYYPAAAALLAFVIIGGLVTAYRVKSTFTEGYVKEGQAKPDGAGATAGVAVPTRTGGAGGEAIDPGSYVDRQIPRVATAPWSAPLWDNREVQSDPQVFCIASKAGDDGLGAYRDGDSCQCMTEQGTPYAMSVDDCNATARRGAAYNPFKAPPEEGRMVSRSERGDGDTPSAMGGTPAVVGIGQEGDLVAPQGGFRSEPSTAL